MSLYTSAFKKVGDKLFIQTDRVHPWGVLHNDSPFEMSTLPSLTHYIYSRILPEKFHDEIRKIENPSDATDFVQETYEQLMSEIEYDSFKKVYSHLLSTNKSFERELRQTGFLVAQAPEPICIMSTRVLNEWKKEQRHTSPEISTITADHSFHPFFNMEFNFETRKFQNVAEYIYFKKLMFFHSDIKYNYEFVRLNAQFLDKMFKSVQVTFFDRLVQSACEEGLYRKFTPFSRYATVLKLSPVEFEVVDNGMLSFWVQKYTNEIIYTIRTSISMEEPKHNLKYDVFLKDEFLYKWVTEHRLPDIIHNYDIIVRSLHPTKLTPSQHVHAIKQMMTYLYFPCECDWDTTFVHEPPESFYHILYEKTDNPIFFHPEIVYVLWSFISILFHQVDAEYKRTGQTPKHTISQYIQETSTSDLTPHHIYIAIRSILYCLQQIHLSIFSVFELTTKELTCITDILYIHLPVKDFKQIRPTLYKQIYADLSSMPFTLSKTHLKKNIMDIYTMVENIYKHLHDLSTHTKSRIYVFS